MPRRCRRISFAVSCLIGIAIAAPEASGQTTHLVYIDFIVPFSFRDLHPSIIEVRPSCQVGGPPLSLHPYIKSGWNITGETHVQNMNKSADGSYSVTLTERVEVALPTSFTVGTIIPYHCTVVGKNVAGTTRVLSQAPPQAPQHELPVPFTLAPGSTDKVNGQFTW